MNLISNAAEASPRGGHVRLELEAVVGAVQIRVIDQGDGLPGDLPDRVFDPFFTTKRDGTGLGLSIAYRLIEAHGGRLTAHNRPEGGAEFVVTLTRHDSHDRQTNSTATETRQPSAA